MRIVKKDILPFHFYTYKQPFTGSCCGMRYRIVMQERKPQEVSEESVEEKGAEEQAEAKPENCFFVSVWKEPYAYDHTPEEEIENKEFPFDEEGYEQVVEWLNEKADAFSGEGETKGGS